MASTSTGCGAHFLEPLLENATITTTKISVGCLIFEELNNSVPSKQQTPPRMLVLCDGAGYTGPSPRCKRHCINSKKMRVLLACILKVCSTLQGGHVNRLHLPSQYHYPFMYSNTHVFSSIFHYCYWNMRIVATRRNTFYLILAGRCIQIQNELPLRRQVPGKFGVLLETLHLI